MRKSCTRQTCNRPIAGVRSQGGSPTLARTRANDETRVPRSTQHRNTARDVKPHLKCLGIVCWKLHNTQRHSEGYHRNSKRHKEHCRERCCLRLHEHPLGGFILSSKATTTDTTHKTELESAAQLLHFQGVSAVVKLPVHLPTGLELELLGDCKPFAKARLP